MRWWLEGKLTSYMEILEQIQSTPRLWYLCRAIEQHGFAMYTTGTAKIRNLQGRSVVNPNICHDALGDLIDSTLKVY